MLLVLPCALAAEIQVMADLPVSIEVDGRPWAPRNAERGATATALAGGAHRVQVFDGTRLLAGTTVDVGVTEQVRLELRRGALVELGRGPIAGATPPAAPGTLQITGIDPTNVAVWVDGKPITFASGSFAARNLAAGAHDVRVVRGTATLYAGEMKVYPELVRRCIPDGATLECVHVETLLSVAPPPPPAPPAPPPPAGPKALDEAEFAGILSRVQGESFSSDQLTVLKSAARDRYFTIAQMGRVLDAFVHSSDKMEAAKILAPRVVDPRNAYQLDAHLTFSSEKEEVHRLFGD